MRRWWLAGEFLEHAQVFDNCYGTGVRTVEEALANGEQLLLEIDWQGAAQVRTRLKEARSIFILPPSRGSLEQRLKARSTDTDAVIQRRLQDAARDIAHWSEFDYVVINDHFETALADLLAIVEDCGDRLTRNDPKWCAWQKDCCKRFKTVREPRKPDESNLWAPQRGAAGTLSPVGNPAAWGAPFTLSLGGGR